MSNLVKYAEDEMRRAGLYDADADYGGAVPQAVLALVKAHAEQGHSGGSHAIVLSIFNRVIQYQPLTPLTSDPEEWTDVSAYSGRPLWQSKRSPSAFSEDGGKTWHDLNDPEAGR